MTQTNNKRQRCEKCGIMIKPGEGELTLGDYDSHGYHPGWVARCLDKIGCDKRKDN